MPFLSLPGSPRPLGGSNLHAFPIAYGCWRFAGTDVQAARAKIDAALECGINLFDHADIYGDGEAESLFGRVLAEAPSLRERMLIATKGGIVIGVPYDSSPEHIEAACEASLRRLGVETIDLYQIHRPDFLGHPARVAETLARLRERGRIREVGVSNYSPSQFAALQAHLPFPIATRQPEMSCWRTAPLRDGTLDQCMQYGQTPLAWSPMGGGLLGLGPTGAAVHPHRARLIPLLQLLERLAGEQGVSRGAVALAWLLAHPAGIIPIIGTQRVERIRESVSALGVELTRFRWNEILQTAEGRRLP